MPKPSLLKKTSDTYLNYSWRDKEGHTISKGICPRVNVIAGLGFEFTNFEDVVQHFNHGHVCLLAVKNAVTGSK